MAVEMAAEIGQPTASLPTPALWVDLNQLDENIKIVAAHLDGAHIGWRPHVKGIKVPAIAHQMLQAGAFGITCAKLAEAEVMVAAGIRDILIANQIVGPRKIRRLAHLCRRADVKVAVDNVDNVRALSEGATGAGTTIGVLVEIDLGMHRAGTPPDEPAVALARQLDNMPGVDFRGMMGWEGHTVTMTDPEAKARAAKEAIASLTDSVAQCRERGLPVSIVSAGGSATIMITPFLEGVSEIQAGGMIFGDVFYQRYSSLTQPALFVRSTVTSRPAADRVIVDAGFKSLPAWLLSPEPVGVDNVRKIEMSAEHGVIHLETANTQLQIGDKVDFVVSYSDYTVVLHDELVGVRDETVEVVWPVAARAASR